MSTLSSCVHVFTQPCMAASSSGMDGIMVHCMVHGPTNVGLGGDVLRSKHMDLVITVLELQQQIWLDLGGLIHEGC